MSKPELLTIVTFGRSGSTALQSVLNAHDHVIIRGENYGALMGLWQYWQSIVDTSDRHTSGKRDHPWFGSARLSPQAVLAGLLTQIDCDLLRTKAGTRWAGFKEVRYEAAYFPRSTDLMSYLLFLQEALPGLKFLFNIRDPGHAALSGWWREHPDSLGNLRRTVQNLTDAARGLERLLGKNRVQLVDYDRWNQDHNVLVQALRALGFPLDLDIVEENLLKKLTHGAIRPRQLEEGKGNSDNPVE